MTGKKQSRKRAVPSKRAPRKRVVKRGPDVAASAPAPAPPPPISTTGVTSVDDWLPPPRSIEPAPVDDWLPPPRPIEPRAAVERAATTESPAAAEPGVRPAAAAWLIAADLASLAVIGGLTFLNLAGTGGVVRLILALLFVTCVPGWALARGAGLAGGLTGIAVAVLSSLTICAAASTVMLWLNVWHPLMLLAGLGAVSAVVILWTLPPSFVAARLRT